ncbi:MAG: alpha/beta hydrolase-fold protein [Ferruginibacter sp.]
MKYFLCFTLLLFCYFTGEAQFNVSFKLGKYPLTNDSIFIAGNFNGWNPHNSPYSFSKANEINLQLAAGSYEFKCTGGSWKKAECKANGSDIENRRFTVNGDTTIIVNIEAWKDDFPETPKQHTASKQVHIIDTAFFIPQLNRTRRIWIYLPEVYAKSKKSYPVMYMHDGQNLFDAYTAGFGEWGVDECLDSLIKAGKPACIVVGIDNGPRRLNEYNPYEFEQFGKGEGDQYLEFLVKTLKPYIDAQYRTLPSKENTIIAGSSMGGLISFYAMLQYPGVFGKAGIFSPAFWTAPYIKTVTGTLADKLAGKFFFYIGEPEGETYVKDMTDVQEILGEKSDAMIYSVTDPESRHNEQAWRKWFPEFYNWIMADGFNNIIKVDK